MSTITTEDPEIAPQDLYMRALEPDTILPEQFHHRAARSLRGEQRLMLAVLLDAINIYSKHTADWEHHKRRLFVETRRWIDSEDKQWPFSYLRVCEALDIDAVRLRRTLRARRRAACSQHEEPTISLREPIAPHALASAAR